MVASLPSDSKKKAFKVDNSRSFRQERVWNAGRSARVRVRVRVRGQKNVVRNHKYSNIQGIILSIYYQSYKHS